MLKDVNKATRRSLKHGERSLTTCRKTHEAEAEKLCRHPTSRNFKRGLSTTITKYGTIVGSLARRSISGSDSTGHVHLLTFVTHLPASIRQVSVPQLT